MLRAARTAPARVVAHLERSAKMKTAAIITLIIAIIGLSLAWYGADGNYDATFRIQKGYEKADVGISSKDWSVAYEGVDTIRWGLKDIRIHQGFLGLGLLTGFSFSFASLLLIILAYRKKSNKAIEPKSDPKSNPRG